jgi:hypothetical protein
LSIAAAADVTLHAITRLAPASARRVWMPRRDMIFLLGYEPLSLQKGVL